MEYKPGSKRGPRSNDKEITNAETNLEDAACHVDANKIHGGG